MTYWPRPNLAPPDRTRRTRRIVNIVIIARNAAWRVRHHRNGSQEPREPEPWSPGRW